jgi:cytochrome c biogenesis protein CcmG, thiol:disulfide interchange protein DsbE
MKSKLLFGLCGIALAGLCGCSIPWQVHVPGNDTATPSSATTSGIHIGSQAPGFSLNDMTSGNQVSLKAMLSSGKPVIVNTFASWCGPCNKEAPALESLAKQYRDKVMFVGVNITAGDSLENVKKFVQKYKLTYPILLDSKGDFANDYGVVALPTTYVISAKGNLLSVRQGELSTEQAKALFDSAAKGV